MLEDNIKKHISCLCETHAAEIITKICTASSCNNRLLCHTCVVSHNRLHRHSIVPFTEFLNDKIPDVMDIKAINQEREINTFNNTIIFLEKIEHSLEVVLGLMKNSIFKIHRRAMEHREKMKAKAKPKYSHQDWIRFKEYFMQNKKNFLASEPGKVTPELEAFAVHYGSIITKLDEDPSNVSEEEPVLNGAQFDRSIWEGAVSKSLKGIEDLYNDLFSKSFPVNPGKKIPADHFEYTMGRRINEAKIGSMEASSMGVSPRSSMHHYDKYSTQNTDRVTNIPGRKSANATKPDFRLKLKTAVPDTEINPPMDSFQSNPPGDLLLNSSRVELKNRDEINFIREKGSQTPRYGDFSRRDEVRFSIKGNFDIGPGQATEPIQSQSAHKTQRDRRQVAEALNLNKRIVSDNLLSYK